MSGLDPLLTAADAARILGVTPATVRQMAKRGTLHPAVVSRGGIRLFALKDVLSLARRRAAARPQETSQ